jgi:phosphoribosylamine---glycine ligase
MDRVGILIVSKCLSASAIIDAFRRSENYRPEFYVVERQLNPFNFESAKVHQVVPDLDVPTVAAFARKYRSKISFGLTDTEDFITAGGRDVLERKSRVKMLCVDGAHAVERSKADQRLLFDEIFEGANPRYAVFDPKQYRTESAAVTKFRRFAAEVREPVIKPDAPARGAGVGVWGSDFSTEEEMVAFFRNVYSKGRVVVEERVAGEESSFQAFSDGKHFIVAPQTRDYKRALDGDMGRLTGGMGSYRDSEAHLPFLRPSEWESIVSAEERAFARWRGKGSDPGLRGIVLYDALMHTGRGFKVLERNSRGGNTEQISVLTTIRDDLVEVCFKMLEGSLRSIRFSKEASVVTCAVPQAYGIPQAVPVEKERVDLSGAYALQRNAPGLGVYPMDVRLEGGVTYLGGSRSVAVVGTGASLEEARTLSLAGVDALRGPVRSRRDIASALDIGMSTAHMRALRRERRA